MRQVYEACKEKLPRMIQEPDDYIKIAEFLSPEQYAAVCVKHVDTATDYNNATNPAIAKGKTNKVYEACKSIIHDRVKTVADFNQFNFSQEQCIDLFKSDMSLFWNIINSPDDFVNLLKGASLELCGLVSKHCSYRFPTMLNECHLTLDLTDQQFTAIYDVYQNNFLSAINSEANFNDITSSIDNKRKEEIIKSIDRYVEHFEKLYHFLFPLENKSEHSFFQTKSLDFLAGKKSFEKFFLIKAEYANSAKPEIAQIINLLNNDFSLYEDNQEMKLIYQGFLESHSENFVNEVKNLSGNWFLDINPTRVEAIAECMNAISSILPGSEKDLAVVKQAYINKVIDEILQPPMTSENKEIIGPWFQGIATALIQGTPLDKIAAAAEQHLKSLLKMTSEQPLIEMKKEDPTLKPQ